MCQNNYTIKEKNRRTENQKIIETDLSNKVICYKDYDVHGSRGRMKAQKKLLKNTKEQ